MKLISRRLAVVGLTLLMGSTTAFVQVPEAPDTEKPNKAVPGRKLAGHGENRFGPIPLPDPVPNPDTIGLTVDIESDGSHRAMQGMGEDRMWQTYNVPVTVNGKDAQVMLENEAEHFVKKQRAKGYEPTEEQIAIHLYNCAMLDHIEANRDGPVQSLTSEETSKLIEAAVQSQQQKQHGRKLQGFQRQRQRLVDGSQLLQYLAARREQGDEEEGEPDENDVTREEVVNYIRDTQAKGRPVPTQEDIMGFLAQYGNGAVINAMTDEQIGNLMEAVTAELDRAQQLVGGGNDNNKRHLQQDNMPGLIQAVANGMANGNMGGRLGNALNNGALSPMEVLKFVQAQQASGRLPSRNNVAGFLQENQDTDDQRANILRAAGAALRRRANGGGILNRKLQSDSIEQFVTNFIESEKAAGNVPTKEEVSAAVKGHVSNDGVLSQTEVKQAAVTAVKYYKEWNAVTGGKDMVTSNERTEGPLEAVSSFVGQQQSVGRMPSLEQVAALADRSARQGGIYLNEEELEGIVAHTADKASLMDALKPMTNEDVRAFVQEARQAMQVGEPLTSEELAAKGHNSLFSRVVALAEVEEVKAALSRVATNGDAAGGGEKRARLRKT